VTPPATNSCSDHDRLTQLEDLADEQTARGTLTHCRRLVFGCCVTIGEDGVVGRAEPVGEDDLLNKCTMRGGWSKCLRSAVLRDRIDRRSKAAEVAEMERQRTAFRIGRKLKIMKTKEMGWPARSAGTER